MYQAANICGSLQPAEYLDLRSGTEREVGQSAPPLAGHAAAQFRVCARKTRFSEKMNKRWWLSGRFADRIPCHWRRGCQPAELELRDKEVAANVLAAGGLQEWPRPAGLPVCPGLLLVCLDLGVRPEARTSLVSAGL